jgi:hypothetical protein
MLPRMLPRIRALRVLVMRFCFSSGAGASVTDTRALALGRKRARAPLSREQVMVGRSDDARGGMKRSTGKGVRGRYAPPGRLPAPSPPIGGAPAPTSGALVILRIVAGRLR